LFSSPERHPALLLGLAKSSVPIPLGLKLMEASLQSVNAPATVRIALREGMTSYEK
jgi:hypothetical protein